MLSEAIYDGIQDILKREDRSVDLEKVRGEEVRVMLNCL